MRWPSGIRATLRGEQPIRPSDPFLLRDVVTVLIDCGLRPEECYRLRWDNIRDGGVEVFKGKRKASRRRVPASGRVLAYWRCGRRSRANGFPFDHEERSYREFHPEETAQGGTGGERHHAIRGLRPSAHVPNTMGEIHGPVHVNQAGWTCRLEHHHAIYHLNDDDVLAAMEKARGGHRNRHSGETAAADTITTSPANRSNIKA